MADPQRSDRDGYPSCYSIGYQDGQNDAQNKMVMQDAKDTVQNGVVVIILII